MTSFEKEVLARLAEIEKRLDPSTLAQAIMDANLPNFPWDNLPNFPWEQVEGSEEIAEKMP